MHISQHGKPMKALTFALALLCGAFAFTPSAEARPPVQAGVGIGVGVRVGGFANGLQVVIGNPGFNQRYVAAGLAWVDEPYIYWQTIRDPFTGRVHRVQRIGTYRRQVVIYLDTWTNTYGYFDSYGNPIPWNGGRRW